MFKRILAISFLITIFFVNSVLCVESDTKESEIKDMTRGRIPLVFTATAYASGLYGWGIPYLINENSKTRVYVGSEMVSTFSGFALSLLFTKNYNQGPVVSKTMQAGSLVGTLYGLALPAVFKADKAKPYIATPMLTTPLGTYVGYKLAKRTNMGEGGAELVMFGSIVGGLYGLAIPYLINIEDMDDKDQVRIYAGSAMLAIPAGALAFNEITQRTKISKGRARLIELGAAMGTYYGYSFVLLNDPKKDRPYIASMVAGLPIGTSGGILLTRNNDYENSRSTLIILGTIFGDMFGRGCAYLFGADNWRELTMGAVVGTPIGTFTTVMLTRNMSKQLQEKAEAIESSSLFDVSSKLALIGMNSLLAKHGNSVPLRLELYQATF
jgi:hypothetical protein